MNHNKSLFCALTLAATLGLAPGTSVFAEEIAIPVGQQGDRSAVKLPTTGMSQSSVRATWGTPSEIQGPVGEPAISQWHYPDFIVYFENDKVLHTVLKRKH
ncbi:outer membrane protein assembly factor BamE [Marinobacter salinexigens]|uniref:Outer membrane protein assembly factor BamE n=1 Tax=Marinobacter salinexigens TaxID=2919747 RepID=A0A5B0VLH7_9GAMM|nr:outer membrane protein assembly factor BamE [Marinobacter salinexigens]KAA1174975.1 outer membrane protein assembly factor BamE [Marinobacter salinexigens]